MVRGLRRGTVTLCTYDPRWPREFEAEKRLLGSIFKNHAIAIEHIGSTAVIGLSAKPIIDIEVGLRDLTTWQTFVPQLSELGYQYMPDRIGINEVFLPKGAEQNRTHYLHITQFGSPEWRSVLRFRDALRADATLRLAYEKLKQELATRFPDARKAYSNEKAHFIERVIQS